MFCLSSVLALYAKVPVHGCYGLADVSPVSSGVPSVIVVGGAGYGASDARAVLLVVSDDAVVELLHLSCGSYHQVTTKTLVRHHI